MELPLVQIRQTIDRRVSAILGQRGDWLCRAGCDHCCRSLAAIPDITEPEWRELRRAYRALPQPQQADILRRVHALAEASRPFTCPFLDLDSGCCRVYEQRPIACRSYGFYVERHEGLYCEEIRKRVDNGELNDVVWGNATGIQEQSAQLGSKRSLVEWFKRDSNVD